MKQIVLTFLLVFFTSCSREGYITGLLSFDYNNNIISLYLTNSANSDFYFVPGKLYISSNNINSVSISVDSVFESVESKELKLSAWEQYSYSKSGIYGNDLIIDNPENISTKLHESIEEEVLDSVVFFVKKNTTLRVAFKLSKNTINKETLKLNFRYTANENTIELKDVEGYKYYNKEILVEPVEITF